MPITKKRRMICAVGRGIFGLKRRYPPKQVASVLILATGAIGDVMMSSVLFRNLRFALPQAWITVVVAEWSKGVVIGDRNINEVLTFDNELFIKGAKKFRTLLDLIVKIRKRRHDLAFVLGKSYHWGLLCSLLGAEYRVGFDRFGEGFAHHLCVFYDGSRYECDYYLDLAKALCIPVRRRQMIFQAEEDETARAKAFLAERKIQAPVLGIAPGGGRNPGQMAEFKRWPVSSYTEMVRRVIGKYNIIIFGAAADDDIALQIMQQAGSERVHNVCGRLSIRDSMALMGQCSAVVTHDSGPLHLASAAGVGKIVALFGPTDPTRFAPRQAEVIAARSSCCPCHDVYGAFINCRENCMEKIGVDEVVRSLT